jgi:hypothetical protein
LELKLASSLRDVRLAALLVHSLPGRVLAIDDVCGGRVLVGFGGGNLPGAPDLTPCVLREALASVLADGDPARLGPALGLRRGPVRARILEDPGDDPHIGLGVYRYDRGGEWGFAFATTLPVDCVERLVRDAISELRLEDDVDADVLELGCLKVLHDPGLGVTAAFSEYAAHDALLDEAVGRITIRFAIACLADELVREAY